MSTLSIGNMQNYFGRKPVEGKAVKKGFTLLELVVVMGVLFVLYTLLAPRFDSVNHNKRMTQMRSDMKTISTACLMYEMDSNTASLPSTLSALSTGLSATESRDGEAHDNYIVFNKKNAEGEFLDPWGQAYVYNSAERTISCTPKDSKGKALTTETVSF